MDTTMFFPSGSRLRVATVASRSSLEELLFVDKVHAGRGPLSSLRLILCKAYLAVGQGTPSGSYISRPSRLKAVHSYQKWQEKSSNISPTLPGATNFPMDL